MRAWGEGVEGERISGRLPAEQERDDKYGRGGGPSGWSQNPEIMT